MKRFNIVLALIVSIVAAGFAQSKMPSKSLKALKRQVSNSTECSDSSKFQIVGGKSVRKHSS